MILCQTFLHLRFASDPSSLICIIFYTICFTCYENLKPSMLVITILKRNIWLFNFPLISLIKKNHLLSVPQHIDRESWFAETSHGGLLMADHIHSLPGIMKKLLEDLSKCQIRRRLQY
jgi:hypothetical protein